MDITELKQELLDGKLRHYYIFTGDELALQDVYIDKIAELSGLEKQVSFDVKSIVVNLLSKSLFGGGGKKRLFVVRNDDEFFKSGKWDALLKAKDFQGNILILRYSGIGKATEFRKAHDEVMTQFDFIGGTYLKNRVQAMTRMPIHFCEELVELCGHNYGRISNEIQKIQGLARAINSQMDIAYIEARKLNLIHEEIGDIIFDFTGAVEKRKIPLAYSLYDKLRKTDDGSAIKILSILYNSFRNILAVQCTPKKMQTEQVLGIPQGMIYVINNKTGIYNGPELVNIVKTIRKIEKGIKTGWIEEKNAIPYLMSQIW